MTWTKDQLAVVKFIAFACVLTGICLGFALATGIAYWYGLD